MMMTITFTVLGVLLVGLAPAMAQPAIPKFVLGAVDGFAVESAEVRVKPDKGETIPVKLRGDTQVVKVPAGETDLKKAEPIQITGVASGDRVLVTLMPSALEARRIVVMSSSDIARRNEADRMDWNRRGLLGIVTAKSGSEITLKMRSLGGEKKVTVTVSERTGFRRYAPDSVKFADARKSSLDEVNVGDQVRARGQKSEDGLKVAAEEVVFGTFMTKAGPILAINVEGKEITVKDLTTGKPLVIQVAADSQVKKLPNFAAMFGGGAPGASGPGVPPGGGMHGPGGGPPDLSQMLERIPPVKLEDLKIGETIVVSSTKGASDGRITAIMLVANADMLIRMASMRPGGEGRPGGGGGPGAGAAMGAMGGMMGGGMGGLDLGGMAP